VKNQQLVYFLVNLTKKRAKKSHVKLNY